MGYNYSDIYIFLGYSVVIGAAIGLVYEVFRILRGIFKLALGKKKKLVFNIVTFILDILFFVFAAIISAIFIFYANNGRLRAIALAGSLVGFAAYYNSLGRAVSRLCALGIKFIHSVTKGKSKKKGC